VHFVDGRIARDVANPHPATGPADAALAETT